MKLTMAQALIRFLNQQFLEVDGMQRPLFAGVFTIFGHGNVLGIGQALEEDSGHLRVYQGRNEQGMAHAAIAFAKQSHRQQIMACTSSVGPGAANMITAAALATANRIPLLLLPGDTFATRQPDPVLQQIEQSYNAALTTNDAFQPVSKYWDRIQRPEQLMIAMKNAIRVLVDPAETGAVTICLPQDVQGEAYDYPDIFFKKTIHHLDRRIPTGRELEAAVSLIQQKKRPLMICGGGVRYSRAGQALQTLAEQCKIPFAETQAGKSAIESHHPYNLGGIGVTGNQAANQLAREADLIIGIGTRFTDFTTSSKQLFRHPDCQFLTINVSDFDAGKLDSIKVVADAKTTLERLTQRLSTLGYTSNYVDEIVTAKSNWKKELHRLQHLDASQENFQPEVTGHLEANELAEYQSALGTTLTQTSVIREINQHLDPQSIVVGAAGSLPGDLQRIWECAQTDTYHMEYGYSCMGYEIAGALGAKIAVPDREVYAFVGDGSFLMLHSELLTSLQEGLKINLLLFDNSGFGCINNLQMGHGMDSFGTEFRFRNPQTGQLSGALQTIDYAAVAAGYGVKTYSVHTMNELRQALIDIPNQTQSTLIDIKILPKTMTHDYLSWWNVGAAETARRSKIIQVNRQLHEERKKARPY
ncbi:3D-(3,5/4)-trihydroxycyclohexane-1,2-dione hydrolase [Seinonella peptonophila]|uniref:3D-(3,5/4)-trihydroxycyclohexane-1,2-dione hydrolase n=1 Tax=Seinonella peptonophila TaxID=112248 RepID=A0A1M5A936_9BACL|nr:3D-(3,5/4)-trihydroxycyclohexane-1,2-dione acylhydrolase (decyclizing) [Seinonella peptonophila]SHF26536.1 3D-(3,5/4)-trihydroxycyclohexane-1,2-dione hydrolase [Seinonella peptonophila]